MIENIFKAIGGLTIGVVAILGILVFLGIAAVAWPVILVLMIFGLPFIIAGILAAKKGNHKK